MRIASASVSSFISPSKSKLSSRRASRPSGRRGFYAIAIATAAVPLVAQVQRARADITGFGDGTIDTGWQLNGTALATPPLSGTTVTNLQLTSNTGGDIGSAFYTTAQRVDNFTAQFHYNFLTDGTATPADGVAFILQNDPAGASALGGGGGSLGYGGITNSAAFEINIYNGNPLGVSVQTQGNTGGYAPAGAIDFTSTNGFDVTLQFNGSFLKETLNQGTNTFSNSIAIDVVGAVGATNALVGFSGATGGAWAEQHVSNFSFVV